AKYQWNYFKARLINHKKKKQYSIINLNETKTPIRQNKTLFCPVETAFWSAETPFYFCLLPISDNQSII
ncbi:MAG: hypothetical protein PUK03_01900, partial [Bacteroidales bacterium]|nr:hypothetical protein [Bacteroidales bacterium]